MLPTEAFTLHLTLREMKGMARLNRENWVKLTPERDKALCLPSPYYPVMLKGESTITGIAKSLDVQIY